MKKWVFSAALLSLAYGYAQDNTTPQAEPTPMTMPAAVLQQIAAPKTEDKIEIKPAGRILIDGGAFGANNITMSL